jgi:hypothetical protein
MCKPWVDKLRHDGGSGVLLRSREEGHVLGSGGGGVENWVVCLSGKGVIFDREWALEGDRYTS